MCAPPFSDFFLFLWYRFWQIEFVWILLFHKLDERINLGKAQRFQVNKIIRRKGWRRVNGVGDRNNRLMGMKEVGMIVWAIICDQKGTLRVQLNVKLIIYTMNNSLPIKMKTHRQFAFSCVGNQKSWSCCAVKSFFWFHFIALLQIHKLNPFRFNLKALLMTATEIYIESSIANIKFNSNN